MSLFEESIINIDISHNLIRNYSFLKVIKPKVGFINAQIEMEPILKRFQASNENKINSLTSLKRVIMLNKFLKS